MKLTPYKNQYHHQVVDCPFCKHWVYLRESTKVSPDPLRDLKRHITNQAKNEAFARALAGEDAPPSEAPHLSYYKQHTYLQPVKPTAMKRAYDADLTV